MQGVESFNVQQDQQVRRALSDDELALLVQSTARGPDRFEMSGQLRAMAYRVASATGFRVQELRSLTPESFRVDRPDPSIFLRASSTKNRRPADQPISQSLRKNCANGCGISPVVSPYSHFTTTPLRRYVPTLKRVAFPTRPRRGRRISTACVLFTFPRWCDREQASLKFTSWHGTPSPKRHSNTTPRFRSMTSVARSTSCRIRSRHRPKPRAWPRPGRRGNRWTVKFPYVFPTTAADQG